MEGQAKLRLCPYCGHAQRADDRCGECGGFFDPLSRQATQIAMGPWFIRSQTRPFQPGCSYEVLCKQVKAGKIQPNTIIRGPVTHQFWTLARHTPGVAHLLGYCHACGVRIQPQATRCPACAASFQITPGRNELGLAYPTDEAAAAAQQALQKELNQLGSTPPPVPAAVSPRADAVAAASPAAATMTPANLGTSLLKDILNEAPASPEEKSAAIPLLRTPAELAASLPRHAPASAPMVQGTALDFDPCAKSAEVHDAGWLKKLENRNRQISLTTWLLGILNALMILAVLAMFWFFSQSAQNNQTGQTPSAPPYVAPSESPRPAGAFPNTSQPAP